MKKVLFIASVTSHITKFHIPYLKMFKDLGYEVHVASNGNDEIEYADKHFNLPFERSPFKFNNIRVYKELKRIIDEEGYEIVECNTPTASMITRLSAKKARKKGTRVIYLAHGFHFYKGAPLKNFLLFYPIEKHLSNYTDDLITINEEDYEFAKKKMKAKKIHHIHGIGIDCNLFKDEMSNEEKLEFRKSFGLSNEDFIIFFAGEINNNKNQIAIIEAIKDLIPQNQNFKLLLAGKGPNEEHLKEKIKEYNLTNNVFLIGFRNDVPKILQITNLYISMSKREGLPVNILEARLKGLPIIVSNARGQRELIKDGYNGFVVEINDISLLKEKINLIYKDKDLTKKLTSHTRDDIEKYYLSNVYDEMKRIYLLT